MLRLDRTWYTFPPANFPLPVPSIMNMTCFELTFHVGLCLTSSAGTDLDGAGIEPTMTDMDCSAGFILLALCTPSP